MRRGSRKLSLAFALTICSAACTSVLGDFSSGPGLPGDGGIAGFDATTGAAPEAAPPADARGTMPVDTGVVADDGGPPEDGAVADDGGDSGCGGPCATAISANGFHTCALMTDQTVRCWGSNSYGESVFNGPNPVTVPSAVSGFGPVKLVRLGDHSTCVLLVDGSVWCWGDNSFDMLGTADAGFGPDAARIPSPPTQVVGPGTAGAMAVGAYHACIITADAGQVECWGLNSFGQAGVAGGAPVPTPTVVPVTDVRIVGAGSFTTCFARSTAPYEECIGENVYGELGRGSTPDASGIDNLSHPVPEAVALSSLGTFTITGLSHSTGYHNGIVLLSGDIAIWGDNSNGQLGLQFDGGFSANPTLLPAFDEVTGMSLLQYASCALRVDGSVWCWGSTNFGETGSTANVGPVQTVPAQVTGITGATQIAAGLDHACALVGPGIVECWGLNTDGQLGRSTTNTFDPTPAPVQF